MGYDRLLDIMSSRNSSPAASVVRLGLSILEPGYRVAVAGRNLIFNTGLRNSVKLERPVISIGNLTTGGTGKTPMVIELARRLAANDVHPAILLRGYRATESGSDEAAELKNELGSSAEVEANPDRAAGARQVLDRKPDTDIFLLDDGFQHRQVHRDLNIVLIDATNPFGYDHLLPRGLLREPKSAIKRADAVIITRVDRVTTNRLAELKLEIQQTWGRPPTALAIYGWRCFHDIAEQTLPFDALIDKPAAAACGIGNPAAFISAAESLVGQLVSQVIFDDHHDYSGDELHRFFTAAQAAGAEVILTTDKDWVKWRPLLDVDQLPLPIMRPKLAIEFIEGESQINQLLSEVIK